MPQPLVEMGKLTYDTGLWISVFPPGTSKWNKIPNVSSHKTGVDDR